MAVQPWMEGIVIFKKTLILLYAQLEPSNLSKIDAKEYETSYVKLHVLLCVTFL